MNFENIVEALTSFFQENNFSIAERFKDYIRYHYKSIDIAIAHDWRDRSISVFVEKERKFVAELSDSTISDFFHDDIKLRNDSFFTESLIKFLNGKGNALLRADSRTLSQLTDFSILMTKDYHDNLIRQQSLKSADEAWSRKNYSEFVSHIDKIPKQALSPTYLKKYEYALKQK